jgi:hypothetical protein
LIDHESLESGGLIELLEFEASAGGYDEGAAGEEGFGGALVGVGEGFEIVEDEEGAGAGEGVDEGESGLGFSRIRGEMRL